MDGFTIGCSHMHGPIYDFFLIIGQLRKKYHINFGSKSSYEVKISFKYFFSYVFLKEGNGNLDRMLK